MRKYIIINGTKAWISEREDISAARQTAINICDHSEEVLVRELTEFTDHTKTYVNKTVDGILDDTEMEEVMSKYGLTFSPAVSRDYAFTGGLFCSGINVISIHKECFYVRINTFPLNNETIALIKSIQYWDNQ